MDTFIKGLSEFTGIPSQKLDVVTPFFRKSEVQSGKILLSAGDVASDLWFVTSGILRAYYYEHELVSPKSGSLDNLEITTWIVPAFGFLTDITSYLCQRPGNYYIETLEDSALYLLSYKNYKELSLKYPDLGHFTHEKTFQLLDMRVRMCGLRLAKDRLTMFEQQYPGITNKLPVKIQASYLNIDPSTLSRIRGKR